MSRNSEIMKMPSLAGHFDAPDGYSGRFGWLCGYSADVLFLDDAATRFNRLTRSQRAHQGRIALAVMLDPGNQPIFIQDAPGVAHLPIKANAKKPFRLLHAKVALLGFQHQENRNQWQLRLLVSTFINSRNASLTKTAGSVSRKMLSHEMDIVRRGIFCGAATGCVCTTTGLRRCVMSPGRAVTGHTAAVQRRRK